MKTSPTVIEKDPLGLTFGMLLLRIWLAVRSLMTGVEKFAGTRSSEEAIVIDGSTNAYGLVDASTQKVYGWDHYHGVPAALYDKLSNEPLIPGWFLSAYDFLLGPLLILLGLTLLLGIATRISLFAMGLLYTSLTFGLILIKQDAGVAWLGIHLILIVLALVLSGHNRLAIMKKW